MINAYGKAGHIEKTRKIFDYLQEKKLVSWNSMLSVYSHHGLLDEARIVFEEMPERDTISWNSMLAAYIQSGNLREALSLLERMPRKNLVSYNLILSALAAQGEVDDSHFLFKSMITDYLVTPGKQQYGCIISLFARGGYDRSCKELIDTMPFFPDTHDWTCLASANRIYKSNSLGMGHHNTRKTNAN
ncbi:hypothetical protein SELMODRAFT_110531 [Selaginella moellendorffii]|uniref:Pentacotripeptide-repeat region of PRORP domain-containing protein n=1 Tax=Selaginella moellendorffii TaxID=88036 RepID=D8S7C5_SELML|nr:hypothetical protein SELMODRAFT_110531 [Selaginella moellendorffii]